MGQQTSAAVRSWARWAERLQGGTRRSACCLGTKLFEGKRGQAEASVVNYGSSSRANASYEYRQDTAQQEKINIGELPDKMATRICDTAIYSGSLEQVLCQV